jgi:hypothetical protein
VKALHLGVVQAFLETVICNHPRNGSRAGRLAGDLSAIGVT